MKSNTETIRINQFRLFKNGLIEKLPDINTCLSSLCGIQSQIMSASYLSLFNRVQDIKYEDIDRALIIERSIIRIWGYRSTLHLINACEWDIISSALSNDRSWFLDKINKSKRYDEYLNMSNDILRYALKRESFSRLDIKECFKESDKYSFYISSWGGILIDLSQKGFICQAPINKKANFSHRDKWLRNSKNRSIDLTEANIVLLRNFINSYGPIEITDFAFWRGIGKIQSTEYFKKISKELHKIEVGNRIYYIKDEDKYQYYNFECLSDLISLLYRFDPMLLAYKDKLAMIDPENYKKIWRPAGHIEGVIMTSGYIIGRWNYKKMKSKMLFEYNFFNSESDEIIEQVVNKSREIAKFIGFEDFNYQITHNY